jgi:membrane protein required for beta-lactamase induction
MKLIALFLGLLLERAATNLLHMREPRWLDSYFDQGFRYLDRTRGAAAWFVALAILIVPVLPVLGLAFAFQDVLLGVLYVGFAAFVLLFSLGPRDLGSEVDDYVAAAESGDEEALRRLAKELVESDLPSGSGRRTMAVEEAVLVQANNRIFGVIFWFMILGPSGAWLFRVGDLMRRRAVFEAGRESREGQPHPSYLNATQALFGILAWMPARLLAVGYAMAGSFEDAVSDWRGYYEDCSDKFFHVNDEVLACAGRGALGELGVATQPAVRPIQAAMELVNRALLIWVTAISLFTIFGLVV